MTRKEVIKKLKDILEEATETDDSVCYVTADDADALKAAINSLEIDERYELEYENAERRKMDKRTPDEIKAYIDGYNACFCQFEKVLRQKRLDAVETMSIQRDAIIAAVLDDISGKENE